MGFTSDILSANTISGGTFYGDGSNLTGISGGIGYTYEIGQYVPSQGGIIVHRWLSTTAGGSPTTGTVQNYLVIDTTDLSSSAQWASLDVDISNVESTWDGLTNTINLIAAGAPSGITPGTAADLCNTSTNNGQTDWYLPAIDELSILWYNRWSVAQGIDNAGGTQLKFNPYWSSTEVNINTAWNFSMSTGTAVGTAGGPSGNKTINLLYVRAVRKFSL